MFLSGFIAGAEVMRSLDRLVRGEKPDPLVSIGRTVDGEEERVPHASLHDAEHLISLCAYPAAAVVTDENRLFRIAFYVPGTSRVAATAEIKREIRHTVAIVGDPVVVPSDELWAASADEVRELTDGFASAMSANDLGLTIVTDTRGRDMFSATPRYHCGVEAGVLAVEVFMNYLEGARPALYPAGAIARDKGATSFEVIEWRDRSEARAWCMAPQRKDAVVFWHGAPTPYRGPHSLMIIVPVCDGSQDYAFSVAWRAEVRHGVLLTSEIRGEIAKSTRAQYDAFVQGFEQGLKFHVRTRELDAGWGKLGTYVALEGTAT